MKKKGLLFRSSAVGGGRTDKRQDWMKVFERGSAFSWINSLWRGDTSRVASKHCRAELRANTRRKLISPLNMSLLILYFTLFFHPLLCISVPFFSPASFFPLFFFLHCTTEYLAVSVLSLHRAPPPPLSTPTQIFLSFSASPYNISFCNPAVSLSVFFFHLLCVKSYRVHSSGSLMPVPLCWLHWHKLIFFPLLLQCHWQWHCRLDCVRLSKWIKLTV